MPTFTKIILAIGLCASLVSAQESSVTGIPGGCNPAHPGSCPSSYFDTTSTATAIFTSISGIPGGCNPAHPGSCPSSYFQTTTRAAPSTNATIRSTGGLSTATPTPSHISSSAPTLNVGRQLIGFGALVAATLWLV